VTPEQIVVNEINAVIDSLPEEDRSQVRLIAGKLQGMLIMDGRTALALALVGAQLAAYPGPSP
jgi:hypothetical protein